MVPAKINYKIYQGTTFNEVVRYESAIKVYKEITDISKSAPMVVTAIGHGMVEGWRCTISNVLGMTDVNNLESIYSTAVDTDTITFNDVNSVGFRDYTSGGILEYNSPVSLLGLSARMQIRPKLSSDVVISELTTDNGGIVLNDTDKTITLNIDALDTEAYTFKSAVYSLEIINGTIITTLMRGNLTLTQEITR